MKAQLAILTLAILVAVFLPRDAYLAVLQSQNGVAQELGTGIFMFKAIFATFGLYLIALLTWSPKEPVAQVRPDPLSEGAAWVLGLILMSAAFLRLYHLDVGIWYDEMVTHVNYMDLTLGQIVSSYHDANNHVLFTLLAKVSIALLGDSTWAFRLPAALFGVASIYAAFALSRRFTGVVASLSVAMLLSVSYHHIWFSQNARGYTALLFFSLLSSVYFVDALRSRDWRAWLRFALAGALGAFTHLTIAFLFLAQFIIFLAHILIREAKGQKAGAFLSGLLYGFGVLGLASLTLYALVLPQIFAGALLTSGLQAHSEWTNPIWAIREIISSLQIGFSSTLVVVAGAVVFLAGAMKLVRRDWVIVALFLIPTLLGALVMASIGYTLFPRFFFFAAGFAVIIVVVGAITIGEIFGRLFASPSAKRALRLAPVLAVILASVASLTYVYAPKQAYVSAMNEVDGLAGDKDIVAAIGIAAFPFNDYYGRDWSKVTTAEDLAKLTDQEAPVWAIYTMPVHARTAYSDILAKLEADFEEVGRFQGTLGGGAIVVTRTK